MVTKYARCTAVLIMAWLSVAGAEASLRVQAAGLSPHFDRGVHDYTIPCVKPVDLSVRTPGPARARIGGERWYAGTRTRHLAVEESQSVKIVERSGDRRTRRYFVRCLPADFPTYTYERALRPRSPLYMVADTQVPADDGTRNYVSIFDRHGVPVWWYRSKNGQAIDAKVLANGTIVWARYFGDAYNNEADAAYEFRRPSGALARTLRAAATTTDFHDLQPTADGGYMLISYVPRAGVDTSAYNGESHGTVLDGVIQKLTPDGELIWEWSSADHISLAETGRWWANLIEPYDLVHMNAVEPLPDGDMLISMRHTDAVYRIDGTTGEVRWKLGGEPTAHSLVVLGDSQGEYPFGGQHDVRMTDDGVISVYDNATNLGRPPRIASYRVDGGAASLVDTFSDPDAPVSICCGSARATDDSWLVSWGGSSLVAEYDVSGRRTFTLGLENASYRAIPIDGELSRARLRSGMNRRVAPLR